MALKIVKIRALSFLIAVTVFRGLSTLSDLRPLRLIPPPLVKIKGMYPETTITKSSTFQGFLRYDPLFRMIPRPSILNTISKVYMYRNIDSEASRYAACVDLVGSSSAKNIEFSAIRAMDPASNRGLLMTLNAKKLTQLR